MNQDLPARPDRFSVLVATLIGGIALCWIMLTPPGAGPDEPGHLVRAGALARGQLDGEDIGSDRESGFDVPADYRLPDEECYAFHPSVPVDCAVDPSTAGGSITLPSTADEYPIWGHVPGGLLSRLPGLAPIWWARLGGAIVAVALTSAALIVAARRRPLGGAAVLLGLTPMAWGTFAIVNPSSMATAGAIALWSALIYGAGRSNGARWLAACGWAALALPRRDGLVWACIALVIATGVSGRTVIDWVRDLGRGPRLLVAGSTLVTVAWGLTADSRVTKLVVLAPIALVAVEAVRWTWRTHATTAGRRVATVGGVGAAGIAFLASVVATRPGGWDRDLAERVVGETGNNLIEAVGVLGWLDTTLPMLAIILVCLGIGILAAASLAREVAPTLWAVALLGLVFVTSWTFELAQGNTSGTYWQGRYSLPLLVGIPMLLGAVRLGHVTARGVAVVAGGASLVAMNIAAWAAARRWGVGTDGSLLPWEWDTWSSPLPPLVLLVLLAVFSAALAAVLWVPMLRSGRPDGRRGASLDERRDESGPVVAEPSTIR